MRSFRLRILRAYVYVCMNLTLFKEHLTEEFVQEPIILTTISNIWVKIFENAMLSQFW